MVVTHVRITSYLPLVLAIGALVIAFLLALVHLDLNGLAHN